MIPTKTSRDSEILRTRSFTIFTIMLQFLVNLRQFFIFLTT